MVEQLVASVAALLLPVGFIFLAVGGRRPREARDVAFAGVLSFALALAGYFACGFALQFGGVGLVYRDIPGLKELIWEWSPLDVRWGPGWGAFGLHGFFLTGRAATPQVLILFINQLSLVSLAVFLPLSTLWGRVKGWVLVFLGLLASALLHPAIGNWVWGGGWLANLGKNAGLGHGFVDLLGASSPHLLGAILALEAILVFRLRGGAAQWELPTMPPVHLPLLAILGSFFILLGYVFLLLGSPIYSRLENLSRPLSVVNLLEGMAGGFLIAALYSLFTTRSADILMALRGGVAGLIAAGAGCAFVPLWAGWTVGAVAGLLVPLGLYFFERLVRLEDPAAVLAVNGLSALWGLLSLALFADGSFGQGWNGVPADYTGVPGQGVSGLWVAPGFVRDFPRQLYAQLAGIGAVIAWALVVSIPVLFLCYRLVKGWEAGSAGK